MSASHAVYNSGEHSQCGSYALNPWYLLKTKPCEEDRAKHFVSLMGAQVLLPLYTTSKLQHARPLFPGYMFGRFPLDLFSKVGNAFGMRKIVRFGNEPAIIPARIIDDLQEKMLDSGHIELSPEFSAAKFRHGDSVQVTGGPFRGWHGVFDSVVPGKDRVRILLETLNFTRGFQQRSHGLSINVEVSKFDLMLA